MGLWRRCVHRLHHLFCDASHAKAVATADDTVVMTRRVYSCAGKEQVIRAGTSRSV